VAKTHGILTNMPSYCNKWSQIPQILTTKRQRLRQEMGSRDVFGLAKNRFI